MVPHQSTHHHPPTAPVTKTSLHHSQPHTEMPCQQPPTALHNNRPPTPHHSLPQSNIFRDQRAVVPERPPTHPISPSRTHHSFDRHFQDTCAQFAQARYRHRHRHCSVSKRESRRKEDAMRLIESPRDEQWVRRTSWKVIIRHGVDSRIPRLLVR